MKRFLSLLLALLLCFGFVVSCEKEETPSSSSDIESSSSESSSSVESSSESSSSTETPLSESLNNKVSTRLKEYVDSTDGDYVCIYVRIESATNSEEALYQKMEEKLGKEYLYAGRTANANERMKLYEKNLAKLKENSETPLLLTPEGEVDIKQFTPGELIELMELTDYDGRLELEIKLQIESGDSAYDIARLYESRVYSRAYTESRKIIDQMAIEEFCELLNEDKCRSIEQSPILAWVYLDCERSYLLELQEIPMVFSIGLT